MGKVKKDKKDRGRRSRNTKASPMDFGSRGWIFTLNNPKEDEILDMLEWLNSRKKMKYAFQEEKGEKKGIAHLQGCFYSGSPVKFSLLKKRFDRCHWEKARNIFACKNYCTKMASREGRRWSRGWGLSIVRDPLADLILYKWQDYLLKLISQDADDRSVYWFWSEHGCVGKTSLAKHICLKYEGRAIYVSGSYKDITYAIKRDHKIVMWNLPRANNRALSYKALESIKDGIFFRTKYESEMVIMNPPHVIVFANERPDVSGLSKDRWKIYKISKEGMEKESAEVNFCKK